MTSDLPNDPKKWDGQGPRHDFDSRKAREFEARDRVDVGLDFVLGNSNSASVTCGGTAGKYNLGNRSDNLVEYESARLDNDKRTASNEAETAGTFTSNNTKKAGPLSASKHRYRRISRSRPVQDSYNCMANDKVPLASASAHWFPVASTSVDPDPQQGTTNILFNLKTKNENRVEKNIKPDAVQEPVTVVSASIAAKEACEKWRLGGNQAYVNGLLSKAEEYYTRGVNSISLNETSRSCIQALMMCHSNRAATRMSLGRMREAIGDCKITLAIDPNFTISELLRFKTAGNEAFQAGKHLEAIEHYTSALACNTESRSFTAICFCNRAAAYQALDQITYAIADCSLAIALNSSYPKAISRRATLYEMIRDYGQAVNDLNRLISLLEKQSEDGDIISGEIIRSSKNCNDLKRARIRLSAMEEEARKAIPLDMYMILGVEQTCSAADVKKAYRKAALRHHPDKAGHYLTRSENINDGLWREVAVEVHTDADRLFKMIGEAYAILSDSVKRQQYDEEEEMRKCIKKKGYSGRSGGDGYGYERGFDRRQWQPYGSSHHRWSYSDW